MGIVIAADLLVHVNLYMLKNSRAYLLSVIDVLLDYASYAYCDSIFISDFSVLGSRQYP